MQDILSAVVLAAIYFLFSIGISLTWGTIGILNIAHGTIFMFSAFVAHLISTITTLPAVLYVVISVLVGAAIATVLHVVVFQPIRRRASTPQAAELQIIIGGVGLGAVAVAVVTNTADATSFGFGAQTGTANLDLFGLRITNVALAIVLVALALGIGIALWLRRSRAGLALRAIGVDGETARLMGVDERRLGVLVMAGSGALAGLAGALLTLHLVSIAENTGDNILIKGFAAIILGGVGSIAGVVIGSIVLAFTEVVFLLTGLGAWANAVAFALIFVILLVRPRGLLGRKEVRRT